MMKVPIAMVGSLRESGRDGQMRSMAMIRSELGYGYH